LELYTILFTVSTLKAKAPVPATATFNLAETCLDLVFVCFLWLEAMELALLRSADLTLQHSGSMFILVDTDASTETSTHTTPATYRTVIESPSDPKPDFHTHSDSGLNSKAPPSG